MGLLDRDQDQLLAAIASLTAAVTHLDNQTDQNTRNLKALAEKLDQLMGDPPQGNGQNPNAADQFGDNMGSILECSICLMILHNPVSVVTRRIGPTNHGCRACIVENLKINRRCPLDQSLITAVNDHHLIADIVRNYLERFPDKRRDQADLDHMDSIYRPGQQLPKLVLSDLVNKF
ncbi:MAG: hypothetical protein M1813_009793 [Trichoglossum hirsutum]|nr:MAG: hypothetical protein M1813_009793 [Trichoglossum hirsutum]